MVGNVSEPIKSEEAREPAKAKKLKNAQQLYPPDFDGLEPPTQLWKAKAFGKKEYELRNKKKVTGIVHLPGRGSQNPQILFISPCVLEEEVMTGFASKPGMLRGAAANLFLRCIRRLGIKDEDWYYTALCKYPVKKMKPTAQDIRWNQGILKDEMAKMKPKIVVCLGKPVFDFFMKLKFKLKDIQGGFFRCEEYDCLLFPMDNIVTPLYQPEHLERFLVDLKELKREFATLSGVTVAKVETTYSVIETAEQLQNVMLTFKEQIESGNLHTMAVDCEWHGQTAWGGTLRSLQLCWRPGLAAYIRFTAPKDGKSVYVMDRPLPEIRSILEPLRDSRLKFVGHNIAADGVWMEEHLELPMYGRSAFDTMFAQHCINEYADLKLERNAVKYTDLGRYDIPLLIWKKENKVEGEVEDGYGIVPDSVLIPYACKDVDATMRIYPQLLKQLQRQQLTEYYFGTCLPFVTDGFMEMMRCGLPIDAGYLMKMRETFSRNRDILNDDFREALYVEACGFLENALKNINAAEGVELFKDLSDAVGARDTGALDGLYLRLKDFVGAADMPKILPIFLHWKDAQNFNIDSTDQVRRWLFDVKGFQPLKTTKKDGVQMAWERVKSLPLAKQAQYTPSADKQTIKVLSAKDSLVARVEELKSVGNIVKAFLGGQMDID